MKELKLTLQQMVLASSVIACLGVLAISIPVSVLQVSPLKLELEEARDSIRLLKVEINELIDYDIGQEKDIIELWKRGDEHKQEVFAHWRAGYESAVHEMLMEATYGASMQEYILQKVDNKHVESLLLTLSEYDANRHSTDELTNWLEMKDH